MRALHRNHETSCSVPFNEKLLIPLIREVLRVSWSMLALNPPIDIAMAPEDDVINETRYRRVSSSEFSACGIHHYVWPALLQGGRVITKGEVVTRRLQIGHRTKVPCYNLFSRNQVFFATAKFCHQVHWSFTITSSLA